MSTYQSVNILVKCLAAIVVCGFLQPAFAAENSAENESDSEWMLVVSAGYEQQSANKTTAELAQVSVEPIYQLDNWDFSLNLPWYEKKGDYFIGGVRPRVITRCERVTGLTPARQQVLITKGKITQAQLDACANLLSQGVHQSESASGMGDVTGFAKYNYSLSDDDTWSAVAGLGYKFDNGESTTGIGTGTTDTLLEVGLIMADDSNRLSLTLGYDFSSDDNLLDDTYSPQNYAYANADASHQFTDWLTLGFEASAEQAYIKGGDNSASLMGYVEINPFENLTLQVHATRYLGKDSPNDALGASLYYNF